ncbi:C-factor [Arthrobotrys entomopaga]|nr:C-factor [Arthrobotrys entomopaga]
MSETKDHCILTTVPSIRSFTKYHHDTYPSISPSLSNTHLTFKSVVITGASKGIGAATALSFAKAGCSKIALCARSPLTSLTHSILLAAKEAGHPPPNIITAVVDVTSQSDVESFANRVSTAFNTVDILINNAGYLEEWHILGETEPEEWWKTWEVNMKGTYLVTKFFLPLLLPSPQKTIINISSNGAHAGSPGASAYQISKMAVCRLTEYISNEYHKQGVVVVAVHPGGVLTELAKGMPEHMHELLVDTPELAGDAMVWLGRERREWLSGRFVCVNWDVDELEAKKKEIVEGDLLKFRMVI